jgi:hypothetical protein
LYSGQTSVNWAFQTADNHSFELGEDDRVIQILLAEQEATCSSLTLQPLTLALEAAQKPPLSNADGPFQTSGYGGESIRIGGGGGGWGRSLRTKPDACYDSLTAPEAEARLLSLRLINIILYHS